MYPARQRSTLQQSSIAQPPPRRQPVAARRRLADCRAGWRQCGASWASYNRTWLTSAKHTRVRSRAKRTSKPGWRSLESRRCGSKRAVVLASDVMRLPIDGPQSRSWFTKPHAPISRCRSEWHRWCLMTVVTQGFLPAACRRQSRGCVRVTLAMEPCRSRLELTHPTRDHLDPGAPRLDPTQKKSRSEVATCKVQCTVHRSGSCQVAYLGPDARCTQSC